jgi:Ras-related protein Rab-1A
MVYDITDNETFEHIKNWMNDIDKFAKEGVLKILVGNKCDLSDKRQVSFQKGKEFADSCGVPFFETSAKSAENIENLFVEATKSFITRQISMGNVDFGKPKVRPDSNTLNLTTEPIKKGKKKKACCQ